MSCDKKYTPGPWEVCNSTDVFTPTGATSRGGVEAASNDGWHVADCAVGATTNTAGEECFLFFDEQKANANLIAAAPELLEALEWSTEELKSWWRDQGNYGTTGYDKVLPEFDRIIAKAKGET